MRLAQSDLITQYLHTVYDVTSLAWRHLWPERHLILSQHIVWQEDKHVEEICAIMYLFFEILKSS